MDPHQPISRKHFRIHGKHSDMVALYQNVTHETIPVVNTAYGVRLHPLRQNTGERSQKTCVALSGYRARKVHEI